MKSAHHNTQNASNAQQSSLSIVELPPQNAGSYSGGKSNNGKTDTDNNQSKTTTPLQMTPEEVERQNDYDQNLQTVYSNPNATNDIIVRQTKLALDKFDNDVTTEKVQPKAEKSVDIYPSISEPHEASNTYSDSAYSDVDTNFIDVGQQPTTRNGST